MPGKLGVAVCIFEISNSNRAGIQLKAPTLQLVIIQLQGTIADTDTAGVLPGYFPGCPGKGAVGFIYQENGWLNSRAAAAGK